MSRDINLFFLWASMAYYMTKFGYVSVQIFIALLKVILYFSQFCKESDYTNFYSYCF
jgi:hypothetical protein